MHGKWGDENREHPLAKTLSIPDKPAEQALSPGECTLLAESNCTLIGSLLLFLGVTSEHCFEAA